MHRVRLPFAALLLLVGACNTPAPTQQHATDQLPSRGLDVVQPADVAVAPIRDESGGGAPLQTLRRACYTGLVDRLYSPVSLDYLDQQWTEASFGGAGAADAVLDVVVTKWDTTHVMQRGIVLARAEARLLDVRDPEGQPLWALGLTRRLDVGSAGADAWADLAGELLAGEILQELPERDPIRANR